MENKLRNIVVRGETYQWRYLQYMRHLPHHTSRLLLFNKSIPVFIEVFFHTRDTWTGGNPLNEGLPFRKDGQREILSFNRPKFVAELLELLLDRYPAEQLARLTIGDGNPLIAQMGYHEACEEYRDLLPIFDVTCERMST